MNEKARPSMSELMADHELITEAIARGARYLALGYLAVRYGALAMDIMSTRGRDVALTFAAIIVVASALFWLSRRRRAA